MADTMKAGVSTEQGLAVRDVPRPVPGDEQVLVKVRAAGMNRADLAAASGAGVATRDSLGKPIGMEWSGEIVAVGASVRDLRAGDRVICSGAGGYAEYAVADGRRTMKLDTNAISLEQAAGLPLALMTAHDAVVTHGRIAAGDAVLIQGASSAVGLMALQIAKLKGARLVAGTSTNDGRRARLAEFGADLALDPRNADWPERVLQATGGKGADVIVDMVSGPMTNQCMKAAAVRARLVNVGRLGGAKAEFDFDLHALKRIDYVGVTFRTRSLAEVREIVARMRADLWSAVIAGTLSLPVDKTFPLDQAPAAHAHMRANAHFGKILLVP